MNTETVRSFSEGLVKKTVKNFDPTSELESAIEARKRVLGALNILRDDDSTLVAEYAGELTRLTARIKVLREVVEAQTIFCPFVLSEEINPPQDWMVTVGDDWFTGNFGPGEVDQE